MISKKNNAGSHLSRKCEVDDRKDSHLPISTQVVSNEEHLPISQTAEQKRVEHKLTELAMWLQNNTASAAAKVHSVDVKAKLEAIPTDYVTKLKAKYRAENYQPSITQYGWVLGR